MEVYRTHGEHFKFFNDKYGVILLNHKTEVNIEVKWPRLGYFNFKNRALFCYKIPDRQWKRAPGHKNFSIQDPLCVLLGLQTPKNNKWSMEELSAAIVPTFSKGILGAINDFKKTDVVGRALTSNFALTLPTKKEVFFVLWYKGTPVAEVHPKTKKIHVRYVHLLQEIKDFNHYDENSSWEIVI